MTMGIIKLPNADMHGHVLVGQVRWESKCFHASECSFIFAVGM